MSAPSVDSPSPPQSSGLDQAHHRSPRLSTSQARRAAIAAFLGSMLEYYDFFLYGSAAALVFPTLFFPAGNPTVALMASLVTFGVGYLARPLGGVVLGHFGDRVGRKKVLLISLVVMGSASVGIGCLPTFAQIGIAAPLLLVLARLAQGFSAGGEAAGASALTIEHAPAKRRGVFASFMISGCMAGIVLANLVFIPIAQLPDDVLMSWGWRVPFWLSAVVLVVAYVVRRRLEETPVFTVIASEDETYALPARELFRTQWKDVVKVALAALFAVNQTVVMVYGIAYATSEYVGLQRTTALWVVVAAHAVSVVGVLAAASLSDRIGRRPVWIAGALLSAVMVFVYFWAVSHANVALMFAAAVVFIGGTYSGMNGLWPVTFAEQFATPVRYSGFAIGHGAGLIMAAFAPSISAGIAGTGADGWIPVAAFTATCSLVCATSVFFFRETHDVALENLGPKK
ncbi:MULTISPECIES: MFS transporter [unclassified Mycolicibacterium]|uniref:MFS transporter n=1 Tax=unclassified Mycolicibacterium TaxID=2636767 RepID=UPI001619D3CB|nr:MULTISPECIES: MFS transporter [unclassified Mycolicibacterium]